MARTLARVGRRQTEKDTVMSIRFPTEAANAPVLGEDPAPAPEAAPQDHRVPRGGRAAGDVRGERPLPRRRGPERGGKDINSPGFLHDREGDKT